MNVIYIVLVSISTFLLFVMGIWELIIMPIMMEGYRRSGIGLPGLTEAMYEYNWIGVIFIMAAGLNIFKEVRYHDKNWCKIINVTAIQIILLTAIVMVFALVSPLFEWHVIGAS